MGGTHVVSPANVNGRATLLRVVPSARATAGRRKNKQQFSANVPSIIKLLNKHGTSRFFSALNPQDRTPKTGRLN